jgi:hypothetical protein
MSVESIYRSFLTNKLVEAKAKEGVALTSDNVNEYINTTLDALDLSTSQFNGEDFHVSRNENASAVKMNNTFDSIKQDLTVLYKIFLSLGQGTSEDFRRWKREIEVLEKRLVDLENRIDNLLLLASDTEGYHSFFLDSLTDLSYVDLESTDVAVDTESQVVFINPTLSDEQVTTRITTLNNIQNQDVSFKIRTNRGFKGRNSSGSFTEMFDQDENSFWWTKLYMSENKPVTCELSVKISDEPIDVSSIYLSLHSSGEVSITPLYSLDNYNFIQLPSDTVSVTTSNQATFGFEVISAKWIKFLLTKQSADDTTYGTVYSFEFGFNEIAFYNEVFTIGESSIFISKPISILGANGEVREFSKIALEVCEDVPANTFIRYFVTPGGSSLFSVDSNTKWFPISPLGRINPVFPQVLNLGDIQEEEFGVDETVAVSHDINYEDEDFKNPAKVFNLLSLSSDGSILDEEIEATDVRFVPTETDERILSYQIKDSDYSGSGTGDGLTIDEDSVVIFRNVGVKKTNESSTVRGVQRGWRFENPYYVTLVEISNPDGISIDFGNEIIVIDNKKQTGVVTLSGKTSSFDGIHEVRVHKDNWKSVTPGLNSLTDTNGLIAVDSLYPYNHRLLIEGYDYGDGWVNTDDQVYQGVGLFFERRMKKIDLFDFSNNLVQENKYKYFALDRDVTDTHTGGNSATRVFVVKIDVNNPDFINEYFILRFKLVNQRYSYLRFRADFLTNNDLNCPVMGPYKIKFGD